jgi:hypothetical protein
MSTLTTALAPALLTPVCCGSVQSMASFGYQVCAAVFL